MLRERVVLALRVVALQLKNRCRTISTLISEVSGDALLYVEGKMLLEERTKGGFIINHVLKLP